MESIFWLAIFGGFYAYVGYPLTLLGLGRLFGRPVRAKAAETDLPTVTIVVPAHNESGVIGAKLDNLLALDYPYERLEILVVSDGSTDSTVAIVQGFVDQGPVTVHEVPERKGKANALNTALELVQNDIVVFTDASIMLKPGALRALVEPFSDPSVGCVSGEDIIPQQGGEALYGRYELWLRRQEADLHSIVGASGCFYAQRKHLVQPFPEGEAPDFLSVLNTVREGYRAVSVAEARGEMMAVKSHQDEFQRKVRTLIRGMTAMFRNADLLNPGRYGWFAFALWSHKIMRWLVPVFMLTALVANLMIIREHSFYAFTALLQGTFYSLAVVGLSGSLTVRESLPGKVAVYMVNVNAAIAVAWIKYLGGTRQEIWIPSQR